MKKEKGFSLIEVIMALAILLVAVLPLIAIQRIAHKEIVVSKRRDIAVSFMEREVERTISDTAPIPTAAAPYTDNSAGFEVEISRVVENDMGTPQGHPNDTGTLFTVGVRWPGSGNDLNLYPVGDPNIYSMQTRHYRYHDT